jgi:hypothetical protein
VTPVIERMDVWVMHIAKDGAQTSLVKYSLRLSIYARIPELRYPMVPSAGFCLLSSIPVVPWRSEGGPSLSLRAEDPDQRLVAVVHSMLSDKTLVTAINAISIFTEAMIEKCHEMTTGANILHAMSIRAMVALTCVSENLSATVSGASNGT